VMSDIISPIDLKSFHPKRWILFKFELNRYPGFPGERSFFTSDSLGPSIYTRGVGEGFLEGVVSMIICKRNRQDSWYVMSGGGIYFGNNICQLIFQYSREWEYC
jgi:hypothetical protein